MTKTTLKRKVAVKAVARTASLIKRDDRSPALGLRDGQVFVKAGTTFGTITFKRDADVRPPAAGFVAGTDYGVFVLRGIPVAKEFALTSRKALPSGCLGGFHFALGGNATNEGRGGDSVPQANPCSLWDRNFRPACPDPRGMALIEKPDGKFWCDIYLLSADHLGDGTSRAGVTIADGSNLPQDPAGGRYRKLDYATSVTVMAHHGKQLLSTEEFFAAALGVTERSAAGGDPQKTGLDAARTSKFGLMQATGNMWVWGHCGHPTLPRASLFGGSWFGDDDAGSRYAGVAYRWPGRSYESIGARGRSDHLNLLKASRQRRRSKPHVRQR
ncbi:hypothetical protein AFEL58S_02062 [Afipia felis]